MVYYKTINKKLKQYCIFFMLAFLCSLASLGQTRDISKMSSGGKLNPLQAIMDIRHYTIDLNVDMDQQSIKGNVEVRLNLSKQADTLLLDLLDAMLVTKIKVNNAAVKFNHQNDKIYITHDGGFKQGQQLIYVEYGGIPPVAVKPPWGGGFTWTKDSNGNPWVAINCQFEGGKLYFPCKDHPGDEPNEGVDLNITVPAALTVAGPGLLQKVITKKSRKTFYWKTNYTISNYCVLFNIGKYKVVSDTYTTINGNKVPVDFYVLEVDTAHAKKLIEVKIRDTKILEKYFGEYPWAKEKIGIAEVPNSGMEHQTMITFQNKFVYKTIGQQVYSDNLFHEYAHEWWANKVTNKDWAHMWIQEGIATYAEALAMLELATVSVRRACCSIRSLRNSRMDWQILRVLSAGISCCIPIRRSPVISMSRWKAGLVLPVSRSSPCSSTKPTQHVVLYVAPNGTCCRAAALSAARRFPENPSTRPGGEVSTSGSARRSAAPLNGA